MERLISVDADKGSDPDPDADPDPDRPGSAAPLYVPVRTGSTGGHQLRLARTPYGVRTAIGFSTLPRLTAACGDDQPWIELAEPVLRAAAEQLGAAVVTVDPVRGSRPALLSPLPTTSALGRRIAPTVPCARRALDLSEATSS